MNRFEKANNIAGWLLFIIATTVYALTVEPTASFWDCGEFIAVSYKLEVPHPPGAPFFLLIGRLFSYLAGGDVQKVAYWINMSSVLASGLTIMFLFWTITLLARKVIKVKSSEISLSQSILVLSAGFIGSMVYTFSDSSWFSAVEAEVYAMSSFFTAFVFWAILKWELIEDESRANKWLILIFYMMGLSIGVHLLNLVTLPAMGMIYYFKKYKPSAKGILLTLAISGFLIIFVTEFIIPGLPSIAGSVEIFFVNNIGLPFYSGLIFFLLLFTGLIVYGINYTQNKGKVLLNTMMLGFTFILIGYSSYSLVLIRSNYDTPIDENNPGNIVNFVSYLKREQYGSRPLIYGQYFDAEVTDQVKDGPIYIKGKNKYEISEYKIKYVYNPKRETILPRAYSSQDNHVEEYRHWMGLGPKELPNFADNLEFMFRYQLGYMYMRYFMWNFAGRESDIQGADWLRPWDSAKDMPDEIKNNKARNQYYMIPLILGILGMFYNYRKNQQVFAVLVMLFILTGAALVIYINSPPSEPRERDYIYVGSYYAYAIWIGLGVLGVGQLLLRKIKNKTLVAFISLVICLPVPAIMAIENWNDHDRSNRYFSVDSAKNFLSSCAPNAILFTGGDNDTFPLWYAQEVEGFRTDVRVIVLSYFNTDWYIDQMTRKAYESDPLPFSLKDYQYRQGGPNDYLPYIENPNLKDQSISLRAYLGLVQQDHPGIKVPTTFGSINALPAKALHLEINVKDVLARKLIPRNLMNMIDEDSAMIKISQRMHSTTPPNMRVNIPERMVFRLKRGGLEKNTLMILDLIANNNWERPIYFNNTSLMGAGVDLRPYVVQEGSTYRLLPIQNSNVRNELVNTDVMYDNMMNKFFFRQMNNPKVNYNEDYRNFALNHRSSFNSLAEALLNENRKEDAKKVLLRNLELIPDKAIPYDYTTAQTVTLLFDAGENEKAMQMAKELAGRSDKFLTYYLDNSLSPGNEIQKNLVVMNEMIRVFKGKGEDSLASQLEKKFRNYYEKVNK
jgi:hypothetical protein